MDLKKELKARSCPVSGLKAVLQQRLADAAGVSMDTFSGAEAKKKEVVATKIPMVHIVNANIVNKENNAARTTINVSEQQKKDPTPNNNHTSGIKGLDGRRPTKRTKQWRNPHASTSFGPVHLVGIHPLRLAHCHLTAAAISVDKEVVANNHENSSPAVNANLAIGVSSLMK